MRGSITLRTKIATHPRMIALVAATVVGCLALLMTFVWSLVGASTASAASTTYAVKNLGTLGAVAYGINDSGEVVGQYYSNGHSRAFLYSGGQMQDLQSVAGISEGEATDINNSGQIVGTMQTPCTVHAFLYSSGQVKDLGALLTVDPICTYSRAKAVNDSGQVVGDSSGHAFFYSDGPMQDLGTLPHGAGSDALDINNSGQIVGSSDVGRTTADGPRLNHAFLYLDGQMKDLGTLPDTAESGATGINEAGEIVGASSNSFEDTHAFLYSGGQMQDLGTLGGTRSEATDINASGQIVGSSFTSSGAQHAFLYSGGQMQDLNTLIPADSGMELIRARAINTSGQIVGEAQLQGGPATTAFLATPDGDGDGVGDAEDNCPDVANTDQADTNSNGVGDACEEEAIDNIAPKVMGTNPANNATKVAAGIDVTATFTEDMDAITTDGDPSTINSTTFKLVKLNSDGTTTRIAATVRYIATTKKAKLDVSGDLKSGRTYKATVTSGAQDLAGNALDQNPNIEDDQPKSWKFTVR
jgi:probable HAF family extracellular repeat protein